MKLLQSGSKYLPKISQYYKIAALLCGAAIIFFGCEADIEKVEAFTSPENLPDIYAEDFETTFIDSFQVKSFMKAPVLQEFESAEESFLEFPEGVLLIRYDDNENIVSQITADYARNYDKDKKWEAKNNVVAINAEGDTLKTEYMVWEEGSEKVYSDKFVKIIRADQVITGVGFEADQNLQNWKIKNPKGSFYITVDEDEQNPGDSVKVDNNSLKPVEYSN